ncbi:hypothetical protein HBB16_04415 [Pseudonocardia sp. MCCB 268]|nr:hypothetical protein [Pseudonocardia cytotoxica]
MRIVPGYANGGIAGALSSFWDRLWVPPRSQRCGSVRGPSGMVYRTPGAGPHAGGDGPIPGRVVDGVIARSREWLTSRRRAGHRRGCRVRASAGGEAVRRAGCHSGAMTAPFMSAILNVIQGPAAALTSWRDGVVPCGPGSGPARGPSFEIGSSRNTGSHRAHGGHAGRDERGSRGGDGSSGPRAWGAGWRSVHDPRRAHVRRSAASRWAPGISLKNSRSRSGCCRRGRRWRSRSGCAATSSRDRPLSGL